MKFEMEKNLFDGVASIQEEFFRSGGHGGQNVNKVETAVRLRATISDPSLLQKLQELFPGSVTDSGEFLITYQGERNQHQNRKKAYELLAKKIEAARYVPKERIETKPTAASIENRLKTKKTTGDKKSNRKPVSPNEY